MMRPSMPRFADLVGRAMIDPDFVAELKRAPGPLLARYDLTDGERVVVQQALARLGPSPPPSEIEELKSALLRRLAT
jgi:hypothetical protein